MLSFRSTSRRPALCQRNTHQYLSPFCLRFVRTAWDLEIRLLARAASSRNTLGRETDSHHDSLHFNSLGTAAVSNLLCFENFCCVPFRKDETYDICFRVTPDIGSISNPSPSSIPALLSLAEHKSAISNMNNLLSLPALGVSTVCILSCFATWSNDVQSILMPCSPP